MLTKGDNSKSKKARVVILVSNTLSHPVLHFYLVPSKYSEGYSSYRADTKSISNKTKGNNSKSKKARVVILVATSHLILFYISTKYHKNIQKGIRLKEQERNQCIITVKYNKRR